MELSPPDCCGCEGPKESYSARNTIYLAMHGSIRQYVYRRCSIMAARIRVSCYSHS